MVTQVSPYYLISPRAEEPLSFNNKIEGTW